MWFRDFCVNYGRLFGCMKTLCSSKILSNVICYSFMLAVSKWTSTCEKYTLVRYCISICSTYTSCQNKRFSAYNLPYLDCLSWMLMPIATPCRHFSCLGLFRQEFVLSHCLFSLQNLFVVRSQVKCLKCYQWNLILSSLDVVIDFMLY